MQTLNVDLGDRSYPIHIGPSLLQQADLIRPHIAAKQVLIVSNETVAPLYLDALLQSLDAYQVESVILPDGEQYKTWEVMNTIFDQLMGSRFDRRCTVIALGGGVVGDITGFAAACYQRGVPFIQVPTTLLSQVDSSVGGKTAVNHPLGKNMIGAFYQPQCVLADTSTLNTLDDRQLSAGLAEVIKYGLIREAEFFTWLEQNMDALVARDEAALSYAIEVSCRCKADVVAADELEAGQRALLNLGHTFGHAIENAAGYGVVLHGEAVGIGMCMAAEFSQRLGWLDQVAVERTVALCKQAGLPTQPPAEMTTEKFMDLMAVDKKVRDGQINLVLMKAIGDAVVTAEYPADALRDYLDVVTA